MILDVSAMLESACASAAMVEIVEEGSVVSDA